MPADAARRRLIAVRGGAHHPMFKIEAAWLADQITQFGSADLSPLIHVGSSDLRFRTEIQPWLHEFLEVPLANHGVRIVNFDRKDGEGIDVHGDIMDDETVARLKALRPFSLLCANILEHVADPGLFARRCLDLLPRSGILFVTVPRSYPQHADPIDTMFRPTPEEVCRLFSGTEVIATDIIDVGSYRDDLRRRPWIVFRFLRLLFPFLSLARWRNTAAKLYWLVRPYQVTCVVLRKTSDAT